MLLHLSDYFDLAIITIKLEIKVTKLASPHQYNHHHHKPTYLGDMACV
jgi:hypothetical protein